MAFEDLRYCWDDQRFLLRDIDVHSTFELEMRDSDGEYVSWFGDDDLDENAKTLLRYSSTRRWLSAKASVPDDIYNDLFLGVPEDKQHRFGNAPSKLDYINLEIHEVSAETLEEEKPAKPTGLGTIAYFKASEDSDETVYASFPVSTEVFDQIEKMADQPNLTLSANIKIKCWNWLGPIGDSAVYISKEDRGRHPTYLLELSATANKPTVSSDDITAARPEATSEGAVNKVTGLQTHNESIKLAVWITAVSTALIALAIVFR